MIVFSRVQNLCHRWIIENPFETGWMISKTVSDHLLSDR